MTEHTMVCMYCSHRRPWPAHFPSTLYAVCSECWPAWTLNEELPWTAENHPGI